MLAGGSRVHHVVGLVRCENFETVIARMADVLQAKFYMPVERPEVGIKMAISLDAGVELIAPLTSASGNPIVQSLDALGERWLSVVVATDSLDRACARLEALGHQLLSRQALMDTPQPYADRISRFDQVSFDPGAFGGLPMMLAEVEERH